jgi:hypothetical protein
MMQTELFYRVLELERQLAAVGEAGARLRALVVEWRKRYIDGAPFAYAICADALETEINAVLSAPVVSPPQGRSCCEPAPDRSGRTCDKPKSHDGDHWTYGGKTLTWRAAPVVSPSQDGCINCGEANDGGYMTGFEGSSDEGAVGPFCSRCWGMAQEFFVKLAAAPVVTQEGDAKP